MGNWTFKFHLRQSPGIFFQFWLNLLNFSFYFGSWFCPRDVKTEVSFPGLTSGSLWRLWLTLVLDRLLLLRAHMYSLYNSYSSFQTESWLPTAGVWKGQTCPSLLTREHVGHAYLRSISPCEDWFYITQNQTLSQSSLSTNPSLSMYSNHSFINPFSPLIISLGQLLWTIFFLTEKLNVYVKHLK